MKLFLDLLNWSMELLCGFDLSKYLMELFFLNNLLWNYFMELHYIYDYFMVCFMEWLHDVADVYFDRHDVDSQSKTKPWEWW